MKIKEIIQEGTVIKLHPDAKPEQRSGQTADKPTTGTFVKKAGQLTVYKRTKGGKDFFDFVETPSGNKFKFQSGEPIVYTYSPGKGNLTYGCGSRWARQEILTASAAAQRAGKKPPLPDDLDGAIKVAQDHYAKYKPVRDGGSMCPLNDPPKKKNNHLKLVK